MDDDQATTLLSVGDRAVVLGRVPELAFKEIELTLKRTGSKVSQLTVASGVAVVKASPPPDETWFTRLGGSTKFGHIIGLIEPSADAVTEVVRSSLDARNRIGLSVQGLLPKTALEFAVALKEAGLARRYLVDRSGVLSAAQSKQIRSERDAELLVVAHNEQWIVIQISAVQDIDDFTRRDRGVPVAHGRRGMLPTKLARTLVNLGLGSLPAAVDEPVLLDSFCGTGRVLMEGRLLGLSVFGSDIDPEAVTATIENLHWLDRQYRLEPLEWAQRIEVADARKLRASNGPGSIDLIVTEPDLGPPQTSSLSPKDVTRLFASRLPLYQAFLEQAAEVLQPQGVLVCVFPAARERSLRSEMLDSIRQIGYHPTCSFLVSREDQFIGRDVVVLTRS